MTTKVEGIYMRRNYLLFKIARITRNFFSHKFFPIVYHQIEPLQLETRGRSEYQTMSDVTVAPFIDDRAREHGRKRRKKKKQPQ